MKPSLARLIALLLVGVLLLPACAAVPSPTATATPTPTRLPSATATTSPTPSVTPTRTTPLTIDPADLRGLSLQVWDAFSGPAAAAFASRAAAFNSSNEWGITINRTDFGDYPSLYEAVNAALKSGGTPDMAVTLPEQVLAWDASGAVIDLNPYIGDPLWGLKENEIADVPAAFWAQDVVNGRRLALPAQPSARLLFYNKTWAHQLGFSLPPANADEFRQQACAANASLRTDANPQNDGYGGWVVDPDWQTTLSWMLAFGGGVTEEGGYRFRSDQNLAALQYIKRLYDDHCAWISTQPTAYDSFALRAALFVSGDLAEVPLVAGAMSRERNPDDWTVIPFPGPQAGALVTYGPSYSLLASTPEKQLAAWLFVRWSLSPENQALWVMATGSLPLRTSALDALGAYRATQPQWDAAAGLLHLAQNTPELASWRQVRYLLEDGTLSIFRTNLAAEKIPNVLAQMDAMAEELGKSP
jgi:multiple sugar transport system substrate-binding protein